MKIAELADVNARLSAFMVDDDGIEQTLVTRLQHFQELLNRSRQNIKAGKGLSRNEFWQTVEERNKQRQAERNNVHH